MLQKPSELLEHGREGGEAPPSPFFAWLARHWWMFKVVLIVLLLVAFAYRILAALHAVFKR